MTTKAARNSTIHPLLFYVAIRPEESIILNCRLERECTLLYIHHMGTVHTLCYKLKPLLICRPIYKNVNPNIFSGKNWVASMRMDNQFVFNKFVDMIWDSRITGSVLLSSNLSKWSKIYPCWIKYQTSSFSLLQFRSQSLCWRDIFNDKMQHLPWNVYSLLLPIKQRCCVEYISTVERATVYQNWYSRSRKSLW